MGTRGDDDVVSFKVLPIFWTMRSNMAMLDSFMRKALLDIENNRDDMDLGLFGVKLGKHQIQIHNQSVVTIIVALLYQAIENYFDMKRLKPAMEDTDLESFLNALGGREDFVDGMRAIRNSTFHIRDLTKQERECVAALNQTCIQRGGVHAVMSQMRDTLYTFTEKTFLGQLKVFPKSVYEQME